MAVQQSRDQGKWLQTSVALFSIVVGYIVSSFLTHLGLWLELEARISYYNALAQGFAVLLGLGTFITLLKYQKISSYLWETYGELLKVVWPKQHETTRQTFGIIIGVTIMGFIFGLFDYAINKLLTLFY